MIFEHIFDPNNRNKQLLPLLRTLVLSVHGAASKLFK